MTSSNPPMMTSYRTSPDSFDRSIRSMLLWHDFTKVSANPYCLKTSNRLCCSLFLATPKLTSAPSASSSSSSESLPPSLLSFLLFPSDFCCCYLSRSRPRFLRLRLFTVVIVSVNFFCCFCSVFTNAFRRFNRLMYLLRTEHHHL